MARTANLFNKAKLNTTIIASIIDKAVNFDCKVRKTSPVTSDTLRADGIIKALISASGKFYNTKHYISDKLLNDVLNGNEEIISFVNSELNASTGYTCDNVSNLVYYLVWFTLTDVEPKAKTLNDYINANCAA